MAEGDETFKIVLSNPDSGVIVGNSELIATIVDDDMGFKSLSMSCGVGVMSFDNTCYNSKATPVEIGMKTIEESEETLSGTLKVRYNEFGDRIITAKIADYEMTATCNGSSLEDLINENSKSNKEKGELTIESEITNINFTKISKWATSMTSKETFDENKLECKGLPENIDANISIEATIKTITKENYEVCSGTIKNGLCIVEEHYEPSKTCGEGYIQAEDWCLKE